MRTLSKEEVAILKPQLIEIRNDEGDSDLGDIWGMIDVFDRCMTHAECESVSFDYHDLHYRHEHKYINLMRDLFEKNKGAQLVVELRYSEISSSEHIGIIEELNPLEKHIWMDQIRKLPVHTETDYFEISSLDVLRTLTYLNIREKEFAKFHFLGLDISILGTFDCSMIMFFKDNSAIKEYEEIIQKNHLYLRDVVVTHELRL